MRKLLSGVLIAITTLAASAQQNIYQLSDGGEPWGKKYQQFDREVQVKTMPSFDLQTLRQQDEENATNKNIPYRFGYTHFVDITPANSGTWKELPTGRVWRVAIKSEGAISLNLAFEQVKIAEGAKLFVYNMDRSVVFGAFTQKHVSQDGMFSTELLQGDKIIVELFEPQSVEGQSYLKLRTVTHGYRDLNGYIAKSFGDAGSCMNNVNCPAYAAYSDQKRSVVCLVNGGEFCTGALINNTCNDGTPYVLTANHCGSSGFGSWVFRFNWEAPACTNPGSSPSTAQSISGGTQRAANAGSDMSLVQINSAVPANYNAFFAGWDRQDIVTNNAYGIHHPSGDIKKISFTTGPTVSSTYSGAVTWKTGTWTDGVTEPGSSGSPLFNQSGQIIGQLFGGPSTCSAEGNATNGVDYYGKLFTSWTGGATNSTRLSNWLAPSTCGSAPTTQVGYDPNAISLALDARMSDITSPVAGNTCNSTFTPQATFQNKGTTTLNQLDIKYRLDAGSEVTYNWSGTLATNATATVTLATITASAGAHTLKVYTSAPNGGTDLNHANDTITVQFTVIVPSGIALPLVEGFEGTTFPPTNWSLENSDNAETWERVTTASATGTASARKDNFSNDDNGQVDNLITPYLNLTASPTLTFKVAYARYNAQYFDSLIVWATNDCGVTWSRLYNKGNSTLATAPDLGTGADFVPTAAQWRTETVDLSNFANQNNIRIRFQSRSGYGQFLYIDDINIFSNSSAPTSVFTATDATPCTGQTITLNNTSSGATSYSWSIPGGTPSTSTATSPTVSFAAAGTYTVTLTATNSNGSTNSTQTITVSAVPSAPTAGSNSPVPTGGTINLTASAVSGATYAWTGPNGYTSSSQNPSVPAANGTAGQYCVTVTVNGCTSTSACTQVVVTSNASINEHDAFEVSVFPNPSSDVVNIHTGAATGNGIKVKIVDMTGKTVMNEMTVSESQFSVDISQYAQGVYLLTLQNENGTVTRKIIKR